MDEYSLTEEYSIEKIKILSMKAEKAQKLQEELTKCQLEKTSIAAKNRTLEIYFRQALKQLDEVRKQLNIMQGSQNPNISVIDSDRLSQSISESKTYTASVSNILSFEETIRNPADLLPESLLNNRVKTSQMLELLERYDVISFDIFDTLIFRKFDKPIDVFRLIGHRIGEESFAKLRIQAEKVARELNKENNWEVNINEIYDELEKLLLIDKKKIIQEELQAEKDCCYANPYMKQIFDILLKRKKKIIIISDMYLPKAMLEELLKSCGYTGYKELFVSCEYRCGKGNGSLQKIAKEKYTNNKRVIHIGDNMVSDVEGTRQAGWSALYYRACRDIGNDLRLKELDRLSVSVYNSIVNTHLHASESVYSSYYEHGFRYAGFLVAGFCEWLNEYAAANHIDKILFLARDSDVLYKVYNTYYQKVDTKYVIVSRLAMWEMSFETNPEEFIQYFFKNRANMGNQTIRMALEETDLEFLIKKLEEEEINPDDRLNEENYNKIHDFLISHYVEIADVFSDSKKAGQKYLKEVIGNYKNVCAVDIGWSGQILITMRKQIRELFGNQVTVRGAYMALTNNQDTSGYVEAGIITPYVFHGCMNQEVAINTATIEGDMQAKFMEATFTSSAATLLKYALDSKGDLKFIYGVQTADERKINEIQKGIIDFVDKWKTQTRWFKEYVKIMPADAMRVFNCAIKNPRYCYAIFGDNLEWTMPLPNYKGMGTITTLGGMLKERGLVSEE